MSETIRSIFRLVVFFLLVAVVCPVATAQSLDEELVRLLDENCIVLGGGQSPRDPMLFGTALIAFCSAPPSANGASTGGGAASAQSSMFSVQNDVIQRRTERARRATGGATATLLDRHGERAPTLLTMLAAEDDGSDFRARRFDLFASLGYESLDRDTTSLEDGYDSTVGSATVGADYRFNDKVLAGLVVSLSEQDADFSGGGAYEMTSIDPTAFVSFLTSPNTFLQVVAGGRFQDFDVDRDVNFTVDLQGGGMASLTGVASSETDADVVNAGILFGYDRAVKQFTFGPRVGLSYSRTEVDAFNESGNSGLELEVDSQTVKSLQGTVGIYGSAALSRGSGVFLPQFGVEYVHEFEDTRDLVSATLVEDLMDAVPILYQVNDPDTGFFNLEAGFSVVLPRGIQPYFNVRAMLGNSVFDSVSAVAGVRFEL